MATNLYDAQQLLQPYNVGGIVPFNNSGNVAPPEREVESMSYSEQTGTPYNSPEEYQQSLQADPYAQWGGQTAYNNLLSGYNTQEQNIYGSAKDNISNYGIGYKNNILDFIEGLKTQQRTIDNRGKQAELAKMQGTSGIRDMVGRGIRSGQTMLSNRNASNSSASEAIARAYGDIGNRQLADVGQQYGQEQNAIGELQQQFGTMRASGLRKFDTEKQQTINSVVLDARNKLAALESEMQEASLPEQINIEAARERVRSEALAQLQGLDQQLATDSAAVNPMDIATRRAQAAGLAAEGTPVENPFSFTSQLPIQLQGTGAPAGNLPLFTIPRSREER